MSTRHHWARTRVTTDDIQRQLGGATQLRGVTVPCMRFPATRRFYIDRLGMRLTGQNRGHAVLESGGVRLVLVDTRKLPGFHREAGQGIYLELRVADLARIQERLAAGGEHTQPPRRTGAGMLVTVTDPEGNLVNLVELRARARR